MTDDPLLEARGLSKVYDTSAGGLPAVCDVDLTVHRGDLIAVTGPSGCGKTTLLHLLGGLARASSGEVVCDGQGLAALDDAGLAQMRSRVVGYVFQSLNLIPELSVAENVALPAVIAGLPANAYQPVVDSLLTSVGLTGRRDERPNRLSGGEQQRVAIARALVMSPRVLLADEPTGSLDSANGREVMTLIHRLNEDGQTVILATHDHRIAASCRRILFLRDGRLVKEVRPGSRPESADAIGRLMDTAADEGHSAW